MKAGNSLYRKLEKILSIFSSREDKNYTFDDIPLINWIRFSNGDFLALSKNDKGNKGLIDRRYEIQDDYINFWGGDTEEVKRYKRVLFEYSIALQKVVSSSNHIGKDYDKVLSLSIEKKELEDKIFKISENDIESVIGAVQVESHFYLDKNKMSAKEFFVLLKEMNKNAKRKANRANSID